MSDLPSSVQSASVSSADRLTPSANPKGTWTYLVFDGEKYKIGKSRDVDKRLQSLRTANPSYELIGKTQTISEKELHLMFRHRRIDREWFVLTPHDVDVIKSLFRDGWNQDTLRKRTYHYDQHRRQTRYKSYVIGFGKYRGVPLTEMTTDKRVGYIRWFMSLPATSGEEERCPRAAFRWWLKELEKTDVAEIGDMEAEIRRRKSLLARAELERPEYLRRNSASSEKDTREAEKRAEQTIDWAVG